MTTKLYRVTMRGALNWSGTQGSHGVSFVMARESNEAYNIVRADLGRRDLGFANDRELKCVELIAEDTEYPDCGTRLYAFDKPMKTGIK